MLHPEEESLGNHSRLAEVQDAPEKKKVRLLSSCLHFLCGAGKMSLRNMAFKYGIALGSGGTSPMWFLFSSSHSSSCGKDNFFPGKN